MPGSENSTVPQNGTKISGLSLLTKSANFNQEIRSFLT